MGRDYVILFKDSPEYFLVENARMIQESNMIRFMCFNNEDTHIKDVWYPMSNVYRIELTLRNSKIVVSK